MILPGIPQFPIRVEFRNGKYVKRPLTMNGHLDATMGGHGLDWSKANGAGLVMGGGFYAIDADAHKDVAVEAQLKSWLEAHKVPKHTRIHRTPSGGYHLLFRLPKEWRELRTRQNFISGCDTRGAGGWIAFAPDLYKVVRDAPLAELSVAACKALHGEGNQGGSLAFKDVASGQAFDEAEIDCKVQHFLSSPGMRGFAARWRGETTGMKDKTRSALDLSVARWLAAVRFTAEQIVWVLLYRFEHGQARWLVKGGLRAAQRCAARAVRSVRDEREELLSVLKTSPEDEAESELMFEDILAQLRKS